MVISSWVLGDMIGRDTCGTYLFRQYHLCYLLKIIKLAVEGSEKNILISKFSHVIVVLPLYVFVVVETRSNFFSPGWSRTHFVSSD